MSYESRVHIAFAVIIVTSLAWAWWKCRLTPEEEQEKLQPSILRKEGLL